MPTYDYVCRACDHAWELFQPMKSTAIRKCPVCGKLRAKRLIGTGAGIIFKGSGFYQTDYRSKSYRASAEADKKAQKPAQSKSDSDGKKSSSESKSATTAASE